MDVEELLAYKPKSGPKRNLASDDNDLPPERIYKRKLPRLALIPDPADELRGYGGGSGGGSSAGGLGGRGGEGGNGDESDAVTEDLGSKAAEPDSEISESERAEILRMIDAEPEAPTLDEMALKKMLLNLEKRILRNQELRIKFPEIPEKFMDSEVDLNETIQEMHIVATQPELYHVLVDLNAVQSLLGLLTHENADISIVVVNLFQEMTDVDTLNESKDDAALLIDTLLEGQVIAMLVQNLERLDESVKEESDGVHNSLAIVENIVEFKPDVCVEAGQQGLLQWLLKRLKARIPFDGNKLYSSEILSILLQNQEDNRKLIGELEGIDVLLQQLAFFKRHDPSSSEEQEMMENLFNCLCSSLLYAPNREKFLKGEGLQLMNLMLREKKMSRNGALKVLDYAVSNIEGVNNCNKFVDILGLRTVFPLFMKTPQKHRRKGGLGAEEHEEHICSIIASMLKNCRGTQRQRLVNKFTENDHEKVDRLMELHFRYMEKVQAIDNVIERERREIQNEDNVVDPETEEEFYIQRLDGGLFSLQLVDYIMLEICSCSIPSIKQRVIQMLNLRGGSIKTVRNVMREYAGNIGDAKDSETKEIEQQRILQLIDKF